ncbi:hypothetical protein KFK09_010693 [Dendrobium nobile]|uniref:Uncharacterized protein n=1 Tax=Dendrobium nobile TaxID=94219 RepID=A0A8T3BCG8_DENNO|nr:hypothetical protein KFK09_010693 [Dendrobium nobile]
MRRLERLVSSACRSHADDFLDVRAISIFLEKLFCVVSGRSSTRAMTMKSYTKSDLTPDIAMAPDQLGWPAHLRETAASVRHRKRTGWWICLRMEPRRI